MGDRAAMSTIWETVKFWVDRAVGLAAFIGLVILVGQFGGAESRAQAVLDEGALREQQKWIEEDDRAYIAACSHYPSSECPALYEDDDDSAPCLVGQVKANRRSGIYHTPGSRWYGRTHADVLCFKTAALAEQVGYRAARGTGD